MVFYNHKSVVKFDWIYYISCEKIWPHRFRLMEIKQLNWTVYILMITNKYFKLKKIMTDFIIEKNLFLLIFLSCLALSFLDLFFFFIPYILLGFILFRMYSFNSWISFEICSTIISSISSQKEFIKIWFNFFNEFNTGFLETLNLNDMNQIQDSNKRIARFFSLSILRIHLIAFK